MESTGLMAKVERGEGLSEQGASEAGESCNGDETRVQLQGRQQMVNFTEQLIFFFAVLVGDSRQMPLKFHSFALEIKCEILLPKLKSYTKTMHQNSSPNKSLLILHKYVKICDFTWPRREVNPQRVFRTQYSAAARGLQMMKCHLQLLCFIQLQSSL